jgi:hypothetical protein
MPKLLIPAVLLVLAVAAASPASATRPVSQAFAFSEYEPVPCDGYAALLLRDIDGTETLFLDDDEVIRVQVILRMDGSVTNATTDETVGIRGHWIFVADLVRGTWTFDGQVFMANDPGDGTLIQDTGRLSFDFEDNLLLDAGPHEAVELGGQVFCDAVAGA